jgi:hydrogenase maturation protein HypF
MLPALTSQSGIDIRRKVRVRGQVQGVGFRPFVYRLATALGLGGWVRNDAAGVEIDVQGDPACVQEFLLRLEREAPALARVDVVDCQPRPCKQYASTFLIQASHPGQVLTSVTPDAAVCPDCLGEMFDPGNQRYRYPFINCTNCGPRYTITSALPYDRPNTSMAGFRMCNDCQTEYEVPGDRRFHAQPNACTVCGPGIRYHDAQGLELTVRDVIERAVVGLEAGAILAIKGLGGFHLVCDAHNAEAVSRLRERKHREEKPFALMAANTQSVARWMDCSVDEQRLLESSERPIVLLRKRNDMAFPGISPGITSLGLMLPYTPLHYLLFHEAAGRPAGSAWLRKPQSLVLVMTSANPGGQPLVTDNDEAMQRLSGIADGFVVHDRDIYLRCDDSVMRWNGRGPGFIRRARGYVPRAIKLPRSGASVLACGGRYKNTICLTRNDEAFVSQHIGDLDNKATCDSLEEVVSHLMQVLDITPQLVAHDLHPDFFSTRFAARFAQQGVIPLVGVQHHHAHIAAVMSEHGLESSVLGVALDGVGLGNDGGIWGGELLHVTGGQAERLAYLKPLALPGGDSAAREPWRMAASALHALGRAREIRSRFPWAAAATLEQMLDKELNCPPTSSTGRLFDAAAGLLGIKPFMRYEGQAAMLLEGLAERRGPVLPDVEGYVIESDGSLNYLPLLARLADTEDATFGAALFHASLAQGLTDWVSQAVASHGLKDVVLAGGCLMNRVLSKSLRSQLEANGLSVYEARQLPPNDGGLSLGQAWVAMCHEQN